MQKLFGLSCLALALTVTAVFAQDRPEDLVRQIIAVFNDMATTLEGAKSGKEVVPQMEKLVAKANTIQRQMVDAKVEGEAEAKLKEKYGEDMKKAVGRFSKAAQALAQRDPQAFEDLGPIFKQLERKCGKKKE